MALNPGGRLDLADIVGRTTEINDYWTVLEGQGLVLSAERRLGKTHIMAKMHEEGRAGFLTFSQDVEKVHSVPELVRRIYETISAHLSLVEKVKGFAWSKFADIVPKRIKDIELAPTGTAWKTLLETAIDDLVSHTEPGTKVVLFWDEFPLMLYNLIHRDKPERAMELLDVLRELRQRHKAQLRFVFTGSVGLHLVLRDLQRQGNANQPVNDMYFDTVPPMVEAEAIEVARRALRELDHPAAEPEGLARAIVLKTEGFPYYIHHVVRVLSRLRRPPVVEDVEPAIDSLLHADQDPANLRYYRDRLDLYYAPDEREAAIAILNGVASASGPLAFEQVVNLARHANPTFTERQLRAVSELLRADHYLTTDGVGAGRLYRFRWALIGRWWKETQL